MVLFWNKCKFPMFHHLYIVYALTCPAAMQIHWNKRKCLHMKRIQLPQDWFGSTTWPPIHCFWTQIWLPWRHVRTFCNYFRLDYQRGRNLENPCFDPSRYLTMPFINSYIFVRDVTHWRHFFYQVGKIFALIVSLYHMLWIKQFSGQEPRKKKLKSRKERNKRRAKAMKVKDVLLADIATRSEVSSITLCNEVCVCLWSNISNMKDRIWLQCKTPKRRLKVRRAAEK